MLRKIHLKIKRQDAPDKQGYWEEFIVPYRENMSIMDALLEIQKNPETKDGGSTSPVVWDTNCGEGKCGACTMIINGRVGLACSKSAGKLKEPIVLEPLTKFPVIRDLWVDRSKMFDALKKAKAWNAVDSCHHDGESLKVFVREHSLIDKLSQCMMCGSCLEACPQYNERSPYVGAHVLGQVLMFNLHPLGKLTGSERLNSVMGIGGISDCGNSQNCVRVCPKGIPLSEAVSIVSGMATTRALREFFL